MDPFSVSRIGGLPAGTAGVAPFGPMLGGAGMRCCGNPAMLPPSDTSGLTQMVMMQQQMTMMLLMILMKLMLGEGGAAGAAGGSSAGAASSGGSAATASAAPIDVSKVQGTEWGKQLAQYAVSHATGTGGWCFKYAGEALRKFGVQTSGASAYMAADQLARSPKFREVKVAESDLPKLPAGAVVVWDRGNGHEHGHISIATGDGREASDVMRKQTTGYGTSFRVFLPNQ